MNNLPIDVSVAAPYTTSTMEGGIRMPSVPALQITPAANFFVYPRLIMPAMTMLPMATTVAGEEPDTAANSMQASTEAIARPPCICPTQASAKSIILRATPPLVIKVPARMKKGIASRG